jgi:hypothetical protein
MTLFCFQFQQDIAISNQPMYVLLAYATSDDLTMPHYERTAVTIGLMGGGALVPSTTGSSNGGNIGGDGMGRLFPYFPS